MLSTVALLLLTCLPTRVLGYPGLQTRGCSGQLGQVTDRCGVCGGDNTTCRVVTGAFTHTLPKVGYHRILEIPEGASWINVTEIAKSRNYLALRSRSGRSIVNGNWAIDRPGQYQGVGTLFTYRRPNEISNSAGESLQAQGPTNEILDVYMIYQQQNPGVQYEYILPIENTQSPLFPNYNRTEVSGPEANTVNGSGGLVRNPGQERYDHVDGDRHTLQTPANHLPGRHREHNWKEAGTTACSASCGRGVRYSAFRCVRRATHEEASDLLCDSSTRPSALEEPCNTQPCPAYWDIGEWSECSRTCGLGMQHRQVLCRHTYANETVSVPTKRCRHLEQPEIATTCQLKICSEWQIHSDWTPCSVPCGVGQRSREVLCVSNLGDVVPDEECNMKLRPSAVENCDIGHCAKSWFLTEWNSQCSAECGNGLMTRDVVCLTNHIGSLPLGGCGPERPPETMACNNGPCDTPTEWFTGQWSQCSAECGQGSQQRAVVCVLKSEQGLTALPPDQCSSEERPQGQRSCHHRACGATWYHTDWSPCSRSCEGGSRVREVRCLSDSLLSSEDCEEQLRPEEQEACNPQPCIPEIDENCQDKYFNCNLVIQARLCVYDYYRTECCVSCSRSAQHPAVHLGHR